MPSHPALERLFAGLPRDAAMGKLVLGGLSSPPEPSPLAVDVIAGLDANPAAIPGIWLYVDDLDRAHRACQDQDTPEGGLWHAIVHRREGDFSNSKYWLRRAGSLAAVILGQDPYQFVDQVQRTHGVDDPELVAIQRAEWQSMIDHCLAKVAK